MSRSSCGCHRRPSKKRAPVFVKDDEKVVSMGDIESIRQNISFGPRLRFDGANEVTEVSEEKTKSEISKKNQRRRRSKSTKIKVNSRKYKETNKMKENKLWRWVGRLENSLENTWDSMKGIMESNSMNHRTFSSKVDKIEKYLASVDNDIAEEIREGDDYAPLVEKTVDSALDFNKAISKMNNVVHMLRESNEEMKKTNWRLINACKTAAQLVQKLVHAQNNVSLLQIHGINHQKPNGSMFSELSTTMFHSNKILHSLYNIPPKMFHSETVLGQHVNETESLSQKVAAHLRQILQTRAPDTVSTTTSASVSVASDLDKTTDTDQVVCLQSLHPGHQHHQDYFISGLYLFFTSAPPAGSLSNEAVEMYTNFHAAHPRKIRLLVLVASSIAAGCALVVAGITPFIYAYFEVTANASLNVVLVDQYHDVLEKAKKSIDISLRRVAKKKFAEDPKAADNLVKSTMERLHTSTSVSDAVRGADLVIEAIVENIDVKRKLFSEIEQNAKGSAILTSNTSSLRLVDIARDLSKKEQLGGLHFFNPVPVMKLLEVVRHENTSDSTYETHGVRKEDS